VYIEDVFFDKWIVIRNHGQVVDENKGVFRKKIEHLVLLSGILWS